MASTTGFPPFGITICGIPEIEEHSTAGITHILSIHDPDLADPPEFADFRTLGCRVFDDEEAGRVAQIWVVEKRMQFFLFLAERDPKTGAAKQFSDWRYVEQERWTGAAKEQNGVCFMAAIRGDAKELATYVTKSPSQ